MQVTLIRHPSLQTLPYTYGQLDVPLNYGWQQEVFHNMKNFKLPDDYTKFDLIISSDSQRCLAMANLLCHSLDFKVSKQMREMYLGQWEGKFYYEYKESPVHFWTKDYLKLFPPRGETYKDMKMRVVGEIISYKHLGYKNICVFTHGGPILAIRAYVNDIKESDDMMAKYLQQPATAITLEI